MYVCMLQSVACNGKSGRRQLPRERGETAAATNAHPTAGENTETATAERQSLQVLTASP